LPHVEGEKSKIPVGGDERCAEHVPAGKLGSTGVGVLSRAFVIGR